MHERRRALLALTMAIALLGAACGGAESEAEEAATRPFDHAQGTTEVPIDPQRIVTTSDQNALLPLLELGVRPVASAGAVLDDGTGFFRRVEGFDTEGIEFVGDYFEVNVEAVAAAEPDLIVGYGFQSDYYDDLSAVAPTVQIQVFGRPLTDALMDFADLVGETERAEEFRAAYEARINDLLTALGDDAERLSVSVITPGDPGTFWFAADGQAIGTVMSDLDFQLPEPHGAWNESDQDAPFSIENLSDHDADVVLVVSFGEDPGLEALLASPLYENLAASQAGQAAVVDGSVAVGAAWARMDAFIDQLEEILLAPGFDVDVVEETG